MKQPVQPQSPPAMRRKPIESPHKQDQASHPDLLSLPPEPHLAMDGSYRRKSQLRSVRITLMSTQVASGK